MDLPPSGFSKAVYRDLLTAFSQAGYRAAGYDKGQLSGRRLILRHDVDYALGPAVAIGEIEAETGWRSSFFVLVATEFYNLFTRVGRQALREIQAQGHEIGLHFDRSVYSGQDEEAAARKECATLEDLLGQPVRVTAFHRPAQTPEVLGQGGLFAERPHAYAPEFFRDIGYVADSAGYWSHGHPLDHAAFRDGQPMQLLTHPYLWMGAETETAKAHIDRVRRVREAFLVHEYRRNLRYLQGTAS
jgi:hypothetical protein